MITVFDKFERTFQGIGMNILQPESCTISEELNGMYELTLYHNFDTSGVWQCLTMQNIIYAPTPSGRQPFRIYKTSMTMEGITVYARHIFYDLLDNMAEEFVVNYANQQEWLDTYKNALVLDQGFTFTAEWQDEGGTGRGFVTKDMNGVAALIEPYHPQNRVQMENRSFVSWFDNMTLKRDKWSVHFQQQSEQSTGFTVEYGKNMLGLTVEEDSSDIITRVYPRVEASDSDEAAPKYSKDYIDSVHVDDYVYPKVSAVKYEDAPLSLIDDDLYEILVNLVTFNYDQKAELAVYINVDFQMISRLEGYEKYKPLEELQIGDVITIIDQRTNLKRQARMISYQWDAILEKFVNIELGTAKESLVKYIKGGGYTPSGL